MKELGFGQSWRLLAGCVFLLAVLAGYVAAPPPRPSEQAPPLSPVEAPLVQPVVLLPAEVLRQGALVRGRVAPGLVVRYRDRELPQTEEGWFALGFGRDAPASVSLQLCPREGECRSQRLEVESRSYRTQYIEGVEERYVAPNPAEVARSRADNAMIAQARRVVSERQDFLGEFRWPVAGVITGEYGSRRVFNGEPRRPHYGVDIAAPEGTPVRAPLGGRVLVAHPDLFFSGGTLILDHGHGVSSTFLHLRRILVGPGEDVTQGQILAEVGATGRVTGAHLDWRVNWRWERLDPQLLAPPMPAPEASQGSQGADGEAGAR